MENCGFDSANETRRKSFKYIVTLKGTGFGGAPEELEDLVSRGRESAVDYLIDYDVIDIRSTGNLRQGPVRLRRSDRLPGMRRLLQWED